MASAEAASIRVDVVFCPAPGQVDTVSLDLPAGSTAIQALSASGLAQRHPACQRLALGVWGRLCAADTPLRHGDRVEVYRPLTVDPKEARRRRHRGQKAGSAPR